MPAPTCPPDTRFDDFSAGYKACWERTFDEAAQEEALREFEEYVGQ